MTFLDFGSIAIKKCCNRLEKEIIGYNDYWIKDGKLMIEVEFNDGCYDEYELEECPACGKPLVYYKTVAILNRKEYK